MVEVNALEAVRTKIMARINQLEDQLKEARRKLQTIDGALGILFEEGEDRNANKVIELRKDRYKDMTLTQAVSDCVNTYGQTRELSPAEIKKLLTDNGLRSKSKNLYSTVFIALKRLADKGLINRVEGKGFTKKQQILTNEPLAKQMNL
jgi:hypothetical protein